MYKKEQSMETPPSPYCHHWCSQLAFDQSCGERQDAKLLLGEVTPASPGDTYYVAGFSAPGFPLCAPGSRAAEVGEKQCLPGKTVCQKVMGVFGFFLLLKQAKMVKRNRHYT